MIDKNSLDKILPLPDIDRLKDEKVKELKEMCIRDSCESVDQ